LGKGVVNMSSELPKNQGDLPYQELLDKNHALEAEIQDLKIRLEEAEELRRAISEGDLDALIIPGPQEKLIFTLDSADRAYRVLVETMNEGTVTLASDGTILYCNRRFAELIKMRSQAIVGMSIYGFIESEDEHTFNALLNQSTNAGEIKLRAKNGMSVPVYLSISSLHSEGSQSAWCLVATDLTEQKKNEEIVSAGRLAQSIIEQAAEAIVVCDTEGKITHFSNVVPIICECEPMFQKFENIMDLRLSEDENSEKNILPVTSALRGDTIIGMEATLNVKDCQGYLQKIHLLLNSGPLKNSDGKIVGCVVTLTDITDRKRAEETLRQALAKAEESDRLLAALMEYVPMGITIADVSGQIRIVSRHGAEMLGGVHNDKSIDEVVAQWKVYQPDRITSISTNDLPLTRAIKKSEIVRDFEIVQVNAHGKKLSLLCNAAPILDTIGNVTGGIVAWYDITERKRAEEELRKSEEISRQRLEEIENLYRNAPIGLCELDRELRYVRLNERLAEINGVSVADHIGKRVRDVLPQSIADKAESQMLRVLETGKPLLDIEIVSETLAKQGIERSWMEQWIPITDIQGFVTGLNIVVEETTERKKMERELQESEEKYRNIVETANEGIWILDPEARITYVNQRMAEMLGYNHEEIIGRSAWDFTDDEGKEAAKQSIEKGRQGIDRDNELKLISKNGTPLWTIVSAKALFDKDGNFMGSMNMLTNITERKEAEVKLKQTLDNLEKLVQERTIELEKAYGSLKESERGLAEAQKMAHIGNWDRSLATNEVHWSDEVYRIFGFKPKEFGVTYSTYLSCVHPDDQDRVIKATKQALEKKLSNIDYRIVLNSGEQRVVHEEFEAVFDEKSNPVQLRGTVQDITERKKAEEALEKMDKIRIKEIHHRIKNNLQVICSLLSLEAERFSDEKMLETLKESQNRVASMALIHEELYKGDKNDTLDFAAYLRKLTADLFSLYSLGNGNIRLKMDLEKVYLDMDTAIPLGIIVNELVSNSLKHAFPAGSEGEVHISLRRAETFDKGDNVSDSDQYCNEIDNFQYILRVADNGKGMPEEIEVENADSLGLQLINMLVDQIDGCVNLRRNCGTEFTIWFGDKEP
jgi:PAS domain S-box-containing protein